MRFFMVLVPYHDYITGSFLEGEGGTKLAIDEANLELFKGIRKSILEMNPALHG